MRHYGSQEVQDAVQARWRDSLAPQIAMNGITLRKVLTRQATLFPRHWQMST
jgi:hypothetical protein